MAKRVEIYVGFKCNNDCLFCVEKKNRQQYKNKVYYQNIKEIETKILELKNQGYTHINFLGGEPFIENNFLTFLQTARKLGFLTAVTTNGSVLSNEKIAATHLPLINDLIISIHGHTKDLINKQSNNPNLYDNLLRAFPNIKKYFKGRILKSNCVITNLNFKNLKQIVEFISQQGIKEISLTNMSIKGYNNDLIVPLRLLKKEIQKVVNFTQANNVLLRFSDVPFCILNDNYHLANELYCDERQKFNIENKEESFMRPKKQTVKCAKCKLQKLCPGVDLAYYELFADKELIPQT